MTALKLIAFYFLSSFKPSRPCHYSSAEGKAALHLQRVIILSYPNKSMLRRPLTATCVEQPLQTSMTSHFPHHAAQTAATIPIQRCHCHEASGAIRWSLPAPQYRQHLQPAKQCTKTRMFRKTYVFRKQIAIFSKKRKGSYFILPQTTAALVTTAPERLGAKLQVLWKVAWRQRQQCCGGELWAAMSYYQGGDRYDQGQ